MGCEHGWMAIRGSTHGDIRSRCTSSAKASAISLPPTFAIACSARQLSISLFPCKSFRIEFTTNLKKSEFSCINRVTARYPCGQSKSSTKHEGWWAYDLLLAIFRARNQIYGFHMPDVYFIPQNIREDDFSDISKEQLARCTPSKVSKRTFSSGIHLSCRLKRQSASAK